MHLHHKEGGSHWCWPEKWCRIMFVSVDWAVQLSSSKLIIIRWRAPAMQSGHWFWTSFCNQLVYHLASFVFLILEKIATGVCVRMIEYDDQEYYNCDCDWSVGNGFSMNVFFNVVSVKNKMLMKNNVSSTFIVLITFYTIPFSDSFRQKYPRYAAYTNSYCCEYNSRFIWNINSSYEVLEQSAAFQSNIAMFESVDRYSIMHSTSDNIVD